jgi:hypothetical protein
VVQSRVAAEQQRGVARPESPWIDSLAHGYSGAANQAVDNSRIASATPEQTL